MHLRREQPDLNNVHTNLLQKAHEKTNKIHVEPDISYFKSHFDDIAGSSKVLKTVHGAIKGDTDTQKELQNTLLEDGSNAFSKTLLEGAGGGTLFGFVYNFVQNFISIFNTRVYDDLASAVAKISDVATSEDTMSAVYNLFRQASNVGSGAKQKLNVSLYLLTYIEDQNPDDPFIMRAYDRIARFNELEGDEAARSLTGISADIIEHAKRQYGFTDINSIPADVLTFDPVKTTKNKIPNQTQKQFGTTIAGDGSERNLPTEGGRHVRGPSNYGPRRSKKVKRSKRSTTHGDIFKHAYRRTKRKKYRK